MAFHLAEGAKVVAGAKVAYEDPVYLGVGVQVVTSMLIGAYSYFGQYCVLGSAKSIGRFCSIAPGVKIGLGMHPKHYMSTSPIFFKSAGMFPREMVPDVGVLRTPEMIGHAPVIGNDVWMGANVTVLRGVTIGHGAIIAAGSLIKEDVRPYAIVAGTPAKEVSRRFSDEIVDRLLATKWWDHDPAVFSGIDVSDVPGQIAVIESRLASSEPRKYLIKEYRS